MNTWQTAAWRSAQAAVVTATVLGCGGGGGTTTDTADLSVLPPDLVLADLRAPGYPPGPYGGQMGDVLPNLTFQGYYSPSRTMGFGSDEAYGEVTFDMMRTSGAKIAILNLAAFW